MADIYIAYAKENKKIALMLFELLSQQWSVWIDRKIVGSFRQAIEKELPGSRCVLAVNSTAARVKPTYTGELQIAENHNVPIIPVKLDDSDPPYPFAEKSCVDMQDWAGGINHSGYIELQSKIALVVPPKNKPQRPLAIAGGAIPLPTLFMSVSSFETQIKPAEAVSVLRVFESKAVLVSAYDLSPRYKYKKDSQATINELKEYQDNGGFILLDSGNYEKLRFDRKRWKPSNLWEVFKTVPHDWAFCFDILKPKRNPEMAIKEIIETVCREKEYTSKTLLPIVHAPQIKVGGYRLEHIPNIMYDVAEKLHPPLIAIPERELGEGIVARALTIKRIRSELDKLPYYQPLHILGTGNPWNIPVFVAAGADSFDGLEWCRMVVDRDNHRLQHFQHFDFFYEFQKGKAESQITRTALEGNDYQAKTIFHNLDYYSTFMGDLREYLHDGNLESFATGIMGGPIVRQLKKQISGLFK